MPQVAAEAAAVRGPADNGRGGGGQAGQRRRRRHAGAGVPQAAGPGQQVTVAGARPIAPAILEPVGNINIDVSSGAFQPL